MPIATPHTFYHPKHSPTAFLQPLIAHITLHTSSGFCKPNPGTSLLHRSMNNFGRSYTAASSRATPQTLCQKCLKRDKLLYTDIRQLVLTSKARHYSYECKGSAQDRPYVPRPSRSQQLANPKLKPKLASDAPNELLRKWVYLWYRTSEIFWD